MKILNIIVLILGLAACAAVAVCLLTDWNDTLFLPLGLSLSVAANALNVLATRWDQGGKERKR